MTTRLHPDRNFSTIACGLGNAEQILARLEYGNVCALLPELSVDGAFCVPDDLGPLIELRRTLELGSDGRFSATPLRTWLASPKPDPRCLRAVLNTGAGPYLSRPLQMGADVVVEYLRDLTGEAAEGVAVVAKTEAALEQFLEAVLIEPDPDLWDGDRIALRDLLSLHALAAQARCDRALVVANYLSCHPAVSWVSYPGLSSDASNDGARRTLEHGFGWRVAFGLEDSSRRFAEGLWGEPGHNRLSSSVTLEKGGYYLLSCGLEEPLDIVGALEAGIMAESDPAAALS